jgi:hypothetical protein
MPLISDCQPPEIFRPGEKAFDFPAAFMPPQLLSVLSFDFGSVAEVRSSQLNTFFSEVFHQSRRSGFVTDKFLRHSTDEETVKGGSVHYCHDPAPFAALCPAGFAGTKLRRP